MRVGVLVMRNRDEAREERRQYAGDVTYEVWRAGGNVDRISDDRVDQAFADGASVDDAARREIRAQRPQEEDDAQQYCPCCGEELPHWECFT